MTIRNRGKRESGERDSGGQGGHWKRESWWPKGSNVNLANSLNSVFQDQVMTKFSEHTISIFFKN